jgi:hypothetical protein
LFVKLIEKLTNKLRYSTEDVNTASQVLLSIYPNITRFRQTNGGARFRSAQNDFILDFNLEFINNSPNIITIDPVGTVRILDKDGNEIGRWILDYSAFAPITIQPNSRSTGWWFNIWGFGSNRLRNKEIINASVTFDIPDYPLRGRTSVIADSTTWKPKLGPGINIIKVGSEDFTPADNQKVLDSLRITREIYEQVDFTLGAVDFWIIRNADAGNYRVINSESEAEDLTQDWTVRNDKLDVFVVRAMIGADGWSAINGPCDKNAKGFNGAVVSLNGSTANAGNTFAHEMGHYLGLEHVADENNFIGNDGASDSNTGIEVWQYKTMRNHCSVRRLD